MLGRPERCSDRSGESSAKCNPLMAQGERMPLFEPRPLEMSAAGLRCPEANSNHRSAGFMRLALIQRGRGGHQRGSQNSCEVKSAKQISSPRIAHGSTPRDYSAAIGIAS